MNPIIKLSDNAASRIKEIIRETISTVFNAITDESDDKKKKNEEIVGFKLLVIIVFKPARAPKV